MYEKYLYTNRKYDLANYSYINNIAKEEDNYIRIERGIILPRTKEGGGVRNDKGIFIKESCYCGDWINLGKDYEPISVEEKNEKVVYLGFFLKHWGHFLIDAIGRTWICILNQFKNYKFVYLLEKSGQVIDGNFMLFLNYLGINENNLLIIDKPTKFTEIIVPIDCIDSQYGFTKGYKKIFQHIILNACIDNYNVPSKVYFSRTKLASYNKTEWGESVIENAFRENGFSIMYPEKLLLQEQIAIFQKAKEIVCLNGTIPLGVVFSSPLLKLVVLNKMSLIHKNLIKLSSVAEVQPIYIDVYYEPLKNHPRYLGEGPFWVEFSSELKKYFRDNGMIYTYKKCIRSPNIYIRYFGVYFIKRIKSQIKKILRL